MSRILFAVFFVLAGCTTVEPGSVGVRVLFGTPNEDLLEPGFHTTGFADVTHVSLRERPMHFESVAYTEDQQEITYELTVTTQMTHDGAFGYVTETEGLYESIIPAKVEDVAGVVIKGRDVWTVNGERELVAIEIKEQLGEALSDYGVRVVDVDFTDLTLDGDFMDAIQARQRAEVEASTALSTLERQTTESRLRVAEAEADAEATVARAAAEAEAIDIQGEALRRNPQVLELRRVERWNGQLPDILVKSDNAPLLQLDR